MSDDGLQRLAAMIPPPDDGMARLQDRRERRQRTRRITAGAVGLALTAAVVGGAWQISRNAPVGPADGAGTAPAADVARITCTTEGATVDTPIVNAQPDGVHVTIENPGEPALYMFESGETQFGERAELPVTTITSTDLVPGTVKVTCYDESIDPSVSAPAAATFEVVDPDGVWVNAVLDCEEPSYGVYDPAPGFTGEEGDPRDIAARELDGLLEEGDRVERAGYLQSEQSAIVRGVRDGRILAAVYLYRIVEGGWAINSVGTCPDL